MSTEGFQKTWLLEHPVSSGPEVKQISFGELRTIVISSHLQHAQLNRLVYSWSHKQYKSLKAFNGTPHSLSLCSNCPLERKDDQARIIICLDKHCSKWSPLTYIAPNTYTERHVDGLFDLLASILN